MSVNYFQIFGEKEISSPFTPAYLTNSTFMICTNECRIRISRHYQYETLVRVNLRGKGVQFKCDAAEIQNIMFPIRETI